MKRVWRRLAQRRVKVSGAAAGTCRTGLCSLVGLLGLVAIESSLQEGDGGQKVVAEQAEPVDIVNVPVMAEAVGQVVPRVGRGTQLSTVRTRKAEETFWFSKVVSAGRQFG